jgi:6-phospho-beta-glucosidase
MKLAVVGAGSTYTPELVDGIARLADELPVTEIVLHDIDSTRLDIVGSFAQRIVAHRGRRTVVRTTNDLDSAVSDASAVLLQLRVGGQTARMSDESFPLRCDCLGQETTGAGGLAKALRTVPVVLDIAERVRELSPDAWIVDFTNPVGIVTRALLTAGHKAVGLCNVAIGFQRLFAEWTGVRPDEVHLGHVGLNHLTWIRDVKIGGRDVLPELLATHIDDLAERLELPRSILDLLGSIPSYYLRYFYAHDEVVRELKQEGTRAARVQEIETELLEMYKDPTLVEKPALLEQRGGAYYSEAAVAMVASLLLDRGDVQVANTFNNGALPFLPNDAVIEVPCRITATGAVPEPIRPLESDYSGLISHVTAYEFLALEAALKGGRDRVERALLAHPLVGQYDLATALTDELLTENQQFLPWAKQ